MSAVMGSVGAWVLTAIIINNPIMPPFSRDQERGTATRPGLRPISHLGVYPDGEPGGGRAPWHPYFTSRCIAAEKRRGGIMTAMPRSNRRATLERRLFVFGLAAAATFGLPGAA